MATYSIETTGTPIVPYTLNVIIPVNHQCNYIDPVVTEFEPESPEFISLFDTYTSNTENGVKTQPEFTTQDFNRNGTWIATPNGTIDDRPAYSLSMLFTIDNAIAEVQTEAQSDLTGEDLDAVLQAAATAKEIEFFGNRPAWSAL